MYVIHSRIVCTVLSVSHIDIYKMPTTHQTLSWVLKEGQWMIQRPLPSWNKYYKKEKQDKPKLLSWTKLCSTLGWIDAIYGKGMETKGHRLEYDWIRGHFHKVCFMCNCMYVWVCVLKCRNSWWPQEGIRCPRPGVSSSREPPNMGAGNRTPVLFKSRIFKIECHVRIYILMQTMWIRRYGWNIRQRQRPNRQTNSPGRAHLE